eukprot:jgi/Chlat1/460/Chrsp103S01070
MAGNQQHAPAAARFATERVVGLTANGQPTPSYACKFNPSPNRANVLAVADEEGFVRLWDTAAASVLEEQHCAKWLAHLNAVFDIAWVKGGSHLLTASGDQTVRLWDVETRTHAVTFTGHRGSVKSVYGMHNNPSCLVSGSRDGSLMLWDSRVLHADAAVSGPVQTVVDAHKVHHCKNSKHRRQPTSRSSPPNGVTAVMFLRDDSLVVSGGAADGVMKYWDLRNLTGPVQHAVLPIIGDSACFTGGVRNYGISSLAQDPNGSTLLASSTSSVIHVFNTLRPESGPLMQLVGHSNKSFFVKAAFSADGSHVVSGSSDHRAYVWRLRGKGGPYVLEGHTEEVTATDWSSVDGERLATCSDDRTVRTWKVDYNSQQKHSTTSRDIISPALHVRHRVTADVPIPPTPSPTAGMFDTFARVTNTPVSAPVQSPTGDQGSPSPVTPAGNSGQDSTTAELKPAATPTGIQVHSDQKAMLYGPKHWLEELYRLAVRQQRY